MVPRGCARSNHGALRPSSAGTVHFYPRRFGGGDPVEGDGGGGGSAAQVRGRAADPGACWEDTPG